MSNFTLTDVLSKKEKGEEWYSFQLPEEFHVWTLINKWKDKAFRQYGVHLSKISVWGALETNKSEVKYNVRAPLFLDCGFDVKKGGAVTKTVTTASFGPLSVDSAEEVNEVMEELSNKHGISVWVTKSVRLYTPDGRELYFKHHNPNGTGTSLYFFRLKDSDRDVLYPDVSLHEQQQLIGLMKLTLAHCTAVEKKEMVHGCAIEVMRKKKNSTTKWIKA